MPRIYEVTLDIRVRQTMQVTADSYGSAEDIALATFDLIGASVRNVDLYDCEDVTDYRREPA
jgi:hypothetical protein